MASSLSLVLVLVLATSFFCVGCLAQLEQVGTRGIHPQQLQRHPLRFREKCRYRRIDTLEPSRRVEAEAGITEIWDENEEQFVCAGAAAVRHVIRPRGLFLPAFTNGSGLQGVVIPGCPETYESGEGSGSRFRGESGRGEGRDRHQKVRNVREGDVLALPAGVTHWIYNRGQSDLVLVSLIFTSNEANQLDNSVRQFFLAGNSQQRQQQQPAGGQQESFGNLLSGFGANILADSFNVDPGLAQRLRGEVDNRGHIVEVRDELQIVAPHYEGGEEMEREWERERETEGRRGWSNGLEETICTLRLRENIDDPKRADFYNPRGGRIATLNSFKLPILRHLQLSAERGILYSDAITAPHYYSNSHGVIYSLRGRARVQIVSDSGEAVFDGELREGQLVVVPQTFAVLKKAGSEGFEWICFRTNDLAMVSPLAGRLSVIRGLPEDVLANAYDMSREESRMIKYGREEVAVFSPGLRD
ncbi:hypothetical protein MLD38_016966 [Melastoma candidum]|uniref:Uncharacterized protein n=1 Tax=Melastoma candidum TaxID=119954 RepID=A0ACB9QXD1_9MYRT|nr:hypothetical protein MLD38_016966 [Melastoma candidum]